jgi:PAB-dependent poly(A)-specific ribonuclease subunit 2
MPYYREQLLSAWPTHLISDVGAPPQKIDPQFMSTLTPIDWGAYGRNTKMAKRNQVSNTRAVDKSSGSLQAPKFLSEKARESAGSSIMDRRISDVADALGVAELSSLKADVPVMYRNVEIKYSKFGVDDFDFGYVLNCPFYSRRTNILQIL